LMATIGAEELRLLQEEDADEYFGELREKIATESDAVRRAELTNELSVAEEVELCRAALEIRLPDATLDGKLVLEGRARTVEVLSLGGGHTESDTIVFLPGERLLITGDLVVVDAHPWVGHGNVPDWLRILDGLEELDACVIVPGHGPVTGAGAVDEVRAYLADLLEAAATDEPELPERYRSWTQGSVFERNVDAVRAGP
jgi:cyclase